MPNQLYDPSTLLGQVRFHAADTDVTLSGDNATFSDEELTYCLTAGLQDPMLAAAIALEALAADQARLAIVQKTESTIDMTHLASSLADRAATLRLQCGVAPSVNPPDQVFSDPYGNETIPGTMEVW